MGWGYCGTNAKTGEEMGYSVDGVCHAEGCDKEIHHGLSYVCGGMHEGGTYGCGYYFCEKHLTLFIEEDDDERQEIPSNERQLCFACCAELEKSIAEDAAWEGVQ